MSLAVAQAHIAVAGVGGRQQDARQQLPLFDSYPRKGGNTEDRLRALRASFFRNRCGGITYKFCARVETMSSVAD
jgi:hypothetical protein